MEEKLILVACQLYEEGKLSAAQKAMEQVMLSEEYSNIIDLNILYLQMLMGKRNWSTFDLNENLKKGNKIVRKVIDTLKSEFSEKQRLKWNELYSEFYSEFKIFVDYVNNEAKDDFFFMSSDEYDTLKEKYYLTQF